MTDILIRGVPDDDARKLDGLADTLGISRNEYLKRLLHSDARRSRGAVTAADFHRFSELAADLDDPDIMRQAWS